MLTTTWASQLCRVVRTSLQRRDAYKHLANGGRPWSKHGVQQLSLMIDANAEAKPKQGD